MKWLGKMIDFNKKHEELYLEELKEILNNHKKGLTAGLENDTLQAIFHIIGKFDLRNTELFLNILQVIKNNSTKEDFDFLCKYRFADHHSTSLNHIGNDLFNPNLSELILEKYGVKNEE